MNKLPITIGIVGHRDAIITKEHKEKIKKIFYDICIKYPNSPLVLFTQLAIGADTEVAEIFLAYGNQNKKDFRLIAPIPFNLNYYKKVQFTTEEELKTFNGLLQQAKHTFVLNKLTSKAETTLANNINANLDELNEYYRIGGEFVADSSIILIALWDEKDNQLEGGSANVVTYKKTGTYQKHISEHIFDKEGSLIGIPCNRSGNNKQITLKENYFNKLLQDASIKKALDKIEELNNSIAATPQTEFDKSADYLFPQKKDLGTQNKMLKDFYTLADVKAIGHQEKYHKILLGLFWLGFIIFSTFETYKHLGLHQNLFAVTVGLIAIAFVVFKLSFKWKNHKNFIENRVLAEALRVQFFWNLSKIKESVSKYILRMHKKEYDWIKHILLSIYGVVYPDEKTKKEPHTVIKKYWIEDQKKYFAENVERLEKKEKLFRRISYSVFGVGLVLLAAIFFVNKSEEYHHYLHPLIVMDSILFGAFALIKAYSEKRGYEQIQTQYELMSDIYNESSKKIDEIDNLNKENEVAEIDNIFFLTGKEAVIENGNWYMIYKDKKPEVEGIG